MPLGHIEIRVYDQGDFVPKKITNPLAMGLPAQIYLLCYTSPQTGYSLGKKIYNVKEGIPPTSKIYPWIKMMIKEGYLKKTSKGHVANVEPLFLQIKKEILTTDSFSQDEQSFLKKLLNSKEFKEYMVGYYDHYKRTGQLGLREVILGKQLEQPFNALQLITGAIGLLCTVLVIRVLHDQPAEDDEKYMEKMYRKQTESETWIQEQLKGIRRHNSVVVYVKEFPPHLRDVLTKFYPHGEVMIKTEKNILFNQDPERFGWRKIK